VRLPKNLKQLVLPLVILAAQLSRLERRAVAQEFKAARALFGHTRSTAEPLWAGKSLMHACAKWHGKLPLRIKAY